MASLRAGEVEAELAPDEGGGVLALRFRGMDVLRPAAAARSGPEGLSCFPLLPFANRINRGRFDWQGRTVTLAPRLGDARHPLHGHGWLMPWTIARIEPAVAVFDMFFEPDDWPWRYAARQTIALDEGGVRLRLELTNTGDAIMPAGAGFHPYFPRRASARLTSRAAGVWLTDQADIPVRLAPPDQVGDFSGGAAFKPDGLIDHCFAGWSGRALVEWPAEGLAVRLDAGANLRWLHLYAPPGEDFFCLEPVSHRPDALNAPSPSAEGMIALAPGETLRAELRMAFSLAEARPDA